MTYRPLFRKQIGDKTTTFDGAICTMSSGAMALDYHTHGAVQLAGGELLQHSGLTKKAEIEDGTNLVDLDNAWKSVSRDRKDPSIKLQMRNNGWDDVLAALANERAVVLQGDYRSLGKKNRCQQMPVVKGHAIVVLPESKSGAFLVGDPLCNGFKFVPAADLKAFAIALGSPNHVFHANTRKLPDDATVKVTVPKTVAVVDERVNPKTHMPIAIADIGPTTLFSDPGGTTVVRSGWPGAVGVGIYARSANNTVKKLAAVRIDTKSGAKEELHIMWVPEDALSNVRVL
jgi:hypothetical protein